MKITKKFLKGHKACTTSYNWVVKNSLIGLDHKKFINKLMEADRFNDANWLITKLFNKKQAIQYAVIATQSVMGIFKKEYPGDDRPRIFIAVYKDYLAGLNGVDANAGAYKAANAAVKAAYADSSIENLIIKFGLKLLKNI
jgi:hypothetical protein